MLDSLQSTFKTFIIFISGLSHFTDEDRRFIHEGKATMQVVSNRAYNFEKDSVEPVIAKLILFMHSTVPRTILISVKYHLIIAKHHCNNR